MKTISFIALASIMLILTAKAEAGVIVGVSVPVGSHDASSSALNHGVWSVSAPSYPLDINTGIGNLINPEYSPGISSFALHDHVFTAANVPDPTRAVVTYRFDTATVVNRVEIIQHTNGILRIEGFVGDSLDSLVSIGQPFSHIGDLPDTPNYFSEGQQTFFDFFPNDLAGLYFQFVVTKVSFSATWAAYRAFLTDENGNRFSHATHAPVPEPSALLLLGIGFAGLASRKRRRH